MTPSLESSPTKAKEAPSPLELRLAPLDTNLVFQCLREDMLKCSFSKQFVPSTSDLVVPIVLIGDNLGSHFPIKVLQYCDENEIYFLCLPPNSTHLCQPLA